jgi:hypoxanthine phosphoribosyltransferase
MLLYNKYFGIYLKPKIMDFLEQRKDLRNLNAIEEWRLIMTEDEIQQCVKKCADVINAKFAGKEVVVACVLKGAVYFFTDLTRMLIFPHSCYFIEASSYMDKQTQNEKVELLSKIVPSKFYGKHVILLDELFDNGTTLARIKEEIHQKANVPYDMIFTCTLFMKNKMTHFPPPDLYGVVLPDVWYVGYGLDDQQEKRNWPYLFACPKTVPSLINSDDAIFSSTIAWSNMRNEIKKQLK